MEARAEQVSEEPRPEHLVGEGDRPRDGDGWQDPGVAAGCERRRSAPPNLGRGFRDRGFRGGEIQRLGARRAPCEQGGQDEHKSVEQRSCPHRVSQSEFGHQPEGRNQGASDRTRRVHRVEHAHPRADFRLAAHRVARQQRERGPHEGRRWQQHGKGGPELEQRGRYRPAFEQLATPTQQADVQRVDQPDADGHRQRGERDRELEHTVDQHGPAQPHRVARGQRGAQREASHVGREHRRHSEFGGPEHEAQLARPSRLIQERGETRHEETRKQQRESGVH